MKFLDSKDPEEREMAQQAMATLRALSGDPTQLATQQALGNLLQYDEARMAGDVPFTPPMVNDAAQLSLAQILRGLSVEDWEKLRVVLNTYPLSEGKKGGQKLAEQNSPFTNSPFTAETTKDSMPIKTVEDVMNMALKDDIVKYIMKVIIPAFNDLGMPLYATKLLEQFGMALVTSQLEQMTA